MEENQHHDAGMAESNSTTPSTPLRPTFLTVLCILTFIGSGWGIIDSITDYLGAETAQSAVEMADDAIDDAMDEMENEDMTESQRAFVENLIGGLTDNLTAKNIRMMAIASLISCIITLLAALMMWRLKKTGYYIYIMGILIFIIAPAFILGGLIGAMYAGATGFVGLVFVLLYGLNLKHMN